MSRKLSFVFALFLSSMVLVQGASAQQTQGRWALGVAGGVNLLDQRSQPAEDRTRGVLSSSVTVSLLLFPSDSPVGWRG